MAPASAPGSPGDPIHYWNEIAGAAWVEVQPLLDRQLAPLGRLALERLPFAPDARVLDVGCGCGATTMEIAQRLGPGGEAVGADVSRPMLVRARERAAQAGLGNVRFVEVDAGSGRLGAACFDAIYSRFGVMFFPEPEAAFRQLARALVPGGRMAFVCWQAFERNPWMAAPLVAAARWVALPPRPPPGAPGPFSLADPARLSRLLAAAGFADVVLEEHAEALALAGGEVDAGVALLLRVGPVAAALRESAADEATRRQVAAAVRGVLEAHATPDGVRMPCAAWLVTASAP